MHCHSRLSAAALGLIVVLAPRALASAEVKMGTRIPNLTFKDIRYLPRTLDDFPKKKALVLVFSSTDCPVAQRYLPTLNRLEKEYRAKGVQFLALNVAADDSIVDIAAQAIDYEVQFPMCKDVGAVCAAAVGVRRTPGVALLDAQRRLCYRGRIDDQYRLGGVRASATRHELQDALEAVLAGRKVRVAETPVDGCLITPPQGEQPKTPVTFAEHVAPLLQKHCQECHRRGGAAPFALVSYRQAAAKADAIAEVVAEQRMPPWFASPAHGKFTNRRGMTARERETVLQWARSGSPAGDLAKQHKALRTADTGKWHMAAPDFVLSMTRPQELPATGDVPYQYIILPHVFLADTWVQGIEVLPDNPRVLHHGNLAFMQLGKKFQESNFITGTVPGGEPMTLDDGVAYCIPAGSVLGLQAHFVTTGKKEKCRIAVGLRFARGVVQKRLRHMLLDDHRFAIPPGAPAHPVKTSRTFDCDAVGVGLFVHMHLRGKDMSFRACRPDGTSETLLVVANYNFSWQFPYRWEPGKMRFPKGTRVECLAHYDNSAFNPYNPNPAATVRDGPQTWQEMLDGILFYNAAAEKLNLDIDPASGTVRTRPATQHAPRTAAAQ